MNIIDEANQSLPRSEIFGKLCENCIFSMRRCYSRFSCPTCPNIHHVNSDTGTHMCRCLMPATDDEIRNGVCANFAPMEE